MVFFEEIYKNSLHKEDNLKQVLNLFSSDEHVLKIATERLIRDMIDNYINLRGKMSSFDLLYELGTKFPNLFADMARRVVLGLLEDDLNPGESEFEKDDWLLMQEFLDKVEKSRKQNNQDTETE